MIARHRSAGFLVLVAAAALSACLAPPASTDADGDEAATEDTGCVSGHADCECSEGLCLVGLLCIDDVCVSPECIPGYFGCDCIAGVCLAGLECNAGVCTEPGGESDSDSESDSGDGDSTGDGGPACGNGLPDPGEACDDADDDNTDGCLDTCELASCGDGYVGPGEGCDDGNLVDDDACDNGCALASCGDGVAQAPEECDDGNPNDTDECLSTCVIASCGDGFVQAGVEECDDANLANDDTCIDGCELASCGDGFVGPGEGCDDANDVDDDACSNACALASCGDGAVQQGEACDDGDLDDTDACLATCVMASCGDGFVQDGVEECDDGNADDADACHNSCELPGCGDGVLHPGEECDDGIANDNHASCTDSCTVAVCGDALIWLPSEECDDGNMVTNDGCDACDGTQPLTMTRGAAYTCLMLTDGSIRCWGDAERGQLGTGSTADIGDQPDEMPPAPIDVGGVAMQLHSGADFSCALLLNGELRCWGGNAVGQLGHGTVDFIGDNPDEMPPPPTNVGGAISQIAVGGQYACVLLGNGQVRCWGANANGQLGQGHTNPIGDEPGEMPPPVVNVGVGNVVQLRAGNSHACVLLDTNKVRCWGRNSSGQLGQGNTNNIGDGPGEMPPANIILGAVAITQIDAFVSGTCVLYSDGALRCFGDNGSGQLGLGHTNTIGDGAGEMPPLVTNYGVGMVSELHGAESFYQILLADGSVRNWGKSLALGKGAGGNVGDQPGEMPPNAVSLGGNVIALTKGATGHHSCAVLDDMTVHCWGENANGELGYGNFFTIGDEPGEMPPAAVLAF